MIENLVGLDIESRPHITNEALKSYEDNLISKVNNNKSIKKPETKMLRITEIKTAIMEFKSGIPNPITDGLIKDFSVNPLLNRICAIGLTYHNYKNEQVSIGIASEDENEIMDWFIYNLAEIQLQFNEDIRFTGHYIQSFDIPSIKLAMIRNKTDTSKLMMKRDVIFPMRKYDNTVIDTTNILEGKLDDIAYAILGEKKINSGSKVYELYKLGKLKEIEDYVIDDARISYEITQKLYI